MGDTDHNKKEEEKKEDEQIARSFGQTLLTKMAMIVIRLIRNAILARVLGPADRGLFSLISSLPDLIMTAGNAGLSNAAAYHTAKQTGSLKHLVGNTNTLILIISFILFFVSLWLVEQPWISKDYNDTLSAFRWVIALAIPLMLLKVVNINLLNVLQRIGSVNTLSLLESLLPLLLFLGLWLIFDVNALIAAVSSWIVGLAIIAILTLTQLRLGFPVKYDTDLQKTWSVLVDEVTSTPFFKNYY